MSNKRNSFRILPILKAFGSTILLGLILFCSFFTIRFCLGLFVKGDYVTGLPGEEPPSVQGWPSATVPVGNQQEYVSETARGKLTITGDVMLHLPIVTSAKSSQGHDFSKIFRYIAPKVTAADYAVANLETTLSGTEKGRQYTGFPKFNSPDAIAAGLQGSGFDMLLTANNHCNDYGTHGLKRTLEVLGEKNLATLGTVSSAAEPHYVVKDVAGIKVGMVCYTYGELGSNPSQPSVNGLPTDPDAAGLINVFDYSQKDRFYEEMAAHIAGMRTRGAETIVLYIHWGNEYKTAENDHQKEMAQKLCDLGVDVIAGSHPHVVQPMELLTSTTDPEHSTVCLYSMGNFLSNQRGSNTDSLPTGHTEDSLLFNLTFVKYSDGRVYLEGVDVLPTWVRVEGSGSNRQYTIIPLEGNPNSWSESFGLSKSHQEAAKASYDRTMELVGPGLSAVQGYLAKEKAVRQPFISVG